MLQLIEQFNVGPVFRHKSLATKQKTYFGSLQRGTPAQQRVLKKKHKRATDAQRYADAIAEILNFRVDNENYKLLKDAENAQSLKQS